MTDDFIVVLLAPANTVRWRDWAMKTTTAEYLELALKFEMLATFEENPKLKADFEQQSAAYRKLAAAGMQATDLKPPDAQ